MPKHTTINDATFGPLLWDPIDHTWGAAIAVPYFEAFGGDLPVFEDDSDIMKFEKTGDPQIDAMGDILSGKASFLSMMEVLIGKSFEQQMIEDITDPRERKRAKKVAGDIREKADSVTGEDPLDAERLFKDGKFKVTFRATDKKKPPTATQRDAWATLLDDADAIFGRMMKRILADYRRQRPVRVQVWKAIYADSPNKLLPDAKTEKALAKVIRPTEFRVHAGGEIGVRFESAWRQAEGFGVLLRDGEVVVIGDEELALAPPTIETKSIDHPDFGPLRQGDGEWQGTVQLAPFRDFYNVTEERRNWRQLKGEYVRVSPPWDFADAKFKLLVYADGGKPPSAAQAAAFRAFRADQKRTADQVLQAILRWYHEIFEDYRDAMKDRGAELMPEAKLPRDLRNLMTLNVVSVHRARGRTTPAIGLSFDCSWDDEHGLGVRWRDGKVEAVGGADEVHS